MELWPSTADQFSDDPVISYALESSQVYWKLDNHLAVVKHFPSINWLDSYSKYYKDLDSYYEQLYPQFASDRSKLMDILSRVEDKSLKDKIHFEGKDKLPLCDAITVHVAEIIRNDFLQQNMFTLYDRCCPLYKACWMAKNIATYHDLAQKLAVDHPQLTIEKFKNSVADITEKVMWMKFTEPNKGQEHVVTEMKKLNDDIKRSFQDLHATL